MAHAAGRPYPKLSEEQQARVCTELLQEFLLENLRPKGGDPIA
jgi:hypothetical protein